MMPSNTTFTCDFKLLKSSVVRVGIWNRWIIVQHIEKWYQTRSVLICSKYARVKHRSWKVKLWPSKTAQKSIVKIFEPIIISTWCYPVRHLPFIDWHWFENRDRVTVIPLKKFGPSRIFFSYFQISPEFDVDAWR